MKRHVLKLIVFCGLASVVGCSPTAEPSTASTTQSEVLESDISDVAMAPVTLVNAEQLAAEMEKRRGKVVLVDNWTSW